MACNLKTAGRRAKWSDIWDSMVVVTLMCSAFDILVFEVIWGLFGAFVSEWNETRKRLAVEQNGVKVGTRGIVVCI